MTTMEENPMSGHDEMPEIPVVEYATVDGVLSSESSGLAEEDVEIRPGTTVRVRELTRKEMLSLRKKEGDIEATECAMVARALVTPRLTESQVALWQERKGFRELEKVTHTIARLSGLNDKADKQAYKSV